MDLDLQLPKEPSWLLLHCLCELGGEKRRRMKPPNLQIR